MRRHADMLWPAANELAHDRAVSTHPTAIRLYIRLIQNPNILWEPQDVKAWAEAEALGASRETVGKALELLIKLGYVIEHGRRVNNVRRVTVAIQRDSPPLSSNRTAEFPAPSADAVS